MLSSIEVSTPGRIPNPSVQPQNVHRIGVVVSASPKRLRRTVLNFVRRELFLGTLGDLNRELSFFLAHPAVDVFHRFAAW